MKNKTKKLSKFKKSVHIDGKEWTYRITSRTLHVCNPEQTKKWTFFTDQVEDYPESYHDDEDSYYFNDWEPETQGISPARVKNFISTKILGLSAAELKKIATKEQPLTI